MVAIKLRTRYVLVLVNHQPVGRISHFRESLLYLQGLGESASAEEHLPLRKALDELRLL